MITPVAQNNIVPQDLAFEVLKQTIGQESTAAQTVKILEAVQQQETVKAALQQVFETGRVDVKI